MTQYKHLSKQFVLPNGTEMALMGLLIYPVLMSADILIYDTDYVSIGEDQTQHLELTINIAERINARYKQKVFKIPQSFQPISDKAGIKIRDLQNPEIKMSKSNKSYDGVIFLDDDEDTIRKKIMMAKTDSLGKINWDREQQPGIANLIEIYAGITEISSEEAYGRLKNNTYKELKEVVAEVVIRELRQIKERNEVIEMEQLKRDIQENNMFCRTKAKRKLDQIKSLI